MEDVPCPSVYVERLGFELDKHFSETRLQVLISPAVLIAKDNIEVRWLPELFFPLFGFHGQSRFLSRVNFKVGQKFRDFETTT